MSLTFAQMTTEIQNLLDDSGSVSQTTVQRWLNSAIDHVARARDWPELYRRDFLAVPAPYDTGTVSISNGSTSLTGSGTAWSTASIDASWKFAPGYRNPWYEIASVGGETAITLADAFNETALSGASYKIYKDVISLPAACNKVYFLWLHDTDRRIPMVRRDDLTMYGWGSYVTEEDTPTEYAHVERDSNGYMAVQIGPGAPDQAYRMEVVYRSDVAASALAADASGVHLDGSRDELILQRAMYLVTRRDRARAAQELQIYEAMLDEEWQKAQEDGGGEFYLEEQMPSVRIRAGERWRDLEG